MLTEVEAIVNSRPLTVVSGDIYNLEAITPSHILTMKSQVVTPPPGEFSPADVYSKKGGGPCNTWQMCFGLAGEENTWSLYNLAKNGIVQEEI